MTRQQNIDTIKGYIRRHPEWTRREDHRAMLNAMIRRVRGPWVDQSEPLPFWPDMAIKHATSGKAAE